MRASRRARARTIDRLALAEVGIVRRAEDAAAEAAQQALEVAVVNVAKQHLRAEVGMHLVSDGRVKLLLVAMLRGQREPCMLHIAEYVHVHFLIHICQRRIPFRKNDVYIENLGRDNRGFSYLTKTASPHMAEPQTRPGLDATQKLQVVVGNCFQKAVELILHARIMPLTPELNRGASNEWVRLRMRAARSRDLPARALANVFSPAAVLARPQFDVRSEELLRVHDELEAWRRDISQPLQLDIFVDATDEPMMRGALGMHAEEPTRVLLERWRLHYDPHDAPATQIALKPIYKRFMVLLRALLAQLRLLPTYRLASSLAKLRGSHAGSLLQYAITLPRSEAGIAAARSRGFAAGAKQYSFPSPDTKEKHGKLEIELLYRPETLFAGRTPTPSCAVFCDAAAIAIAATSASGGASGGGASSAAGAVIGRALIPDYVPPGGVGAPGSAPPRQHSRGLLPTHGLASAHSVQQVAQLTAGLTQLTSEPLVPALAAAPSASPPPPPPPTQAQPPRPSQPWQAAVAASAEAAGPGHSPHGHTTGPSSADELPLFPPLGRERSLSDAASYAAEVRAAGLGMLPATVTSSALPIVRSASPPPGPGRASVGVLPLAGAAVWSVSTHPPAVTTAGASAVPSAGFATAPGQSSGAAGSPLAAMLAAAGGDAAGCVVVVGGGGGGGGGGFCSHTASPLFASSAPPIALIAPLSASPPMGALGAALSASPPMGALGAALAASPGSLSPFLPTLSPPPLFGTPSRPAGTGAPLSLPMPGSRPTSALSAALASASHPCAILGRSSDAAGASSYASRDDPNRHGSRDGSRQGSRQGSRRGSLYGSPVDGAPFLHACAASAQPMQAGSSGGASPLEGQLLFPQQRQFSGEGTGLRQSPVGSPIDGALFPFGMGMRLTGPSPPAIVASVPANVTNPAPIHAACGPFSGLPTALPTAIPTSALPLSAAAASSLSVPMPVPSPATARDLSVGALGGSDFAATPPHHSASTLLRGADLNVLSAYSSPSRVASAPGTLPTTPGLPTPGTPSCSPRASVSGLVCRPRQTSADHELPFMMDDEDEGLEEIPADAFSRFGSGRRRSSISGPRLSGDPDDQVDEAAIGSLMMEVSAARPLRLFGSRDGRASPLSRSIDDISSQLDRLSRTFHGAQMTPAPAGSAAAASIPVMTGPFGASLAPAAAPTSASAPPARDSTEALLSRSGCGLFPFAPTVSEE